MAPARIARALALGALAALAVPALVGAAICDDGNSTGSDGCCSNGQCPSCCLQSSHFGGCSCKGCAGDAVDVGGACSNSDECRTYLTGKNDSMAGYQSVNGCFMCFGEQSTCISEACKTNHLLSVQQFSFTDNIVQCGSSETSGARARSVVAAMIATLLATLLA
mmetsp:Transcript_105022/g.263022  ORF Transcript_105022/g.263022 Transcript_105022/m.263022 type:complete len:164 (+) Transcript_105022:84-575(+)